MVLSLSTAALGRILLVAFAFTLSPLLAALSSGNSTYFMFEKYIILDYSLLLRARHPERCSDLHHAQRHSWLGIVQNATPMPPADN
jgi:hypothetical protein